MRTCRGITFWIFGILALTSAARAQVDALQTQGITPWGSYQHDDFDSINVQNGALTIHIPIYSLPQRGRLSLSFSVRGNTTSYSGVKTDTTCTLKNYCWGIKITPNMNSGLNFGTDQGLIVGPQQFRYPANSNTFFNVYSIKDFLGSVHPLGYDNANPNLLRATDGSGLLFAPSFVPYSPFLGAGDSTIYEPNGIRHISISSSGTTTIQDPDGNSIVFQGIQVTDTLGRVLPIGVSALSSSISGCPQVTANFQPTTSSATWIVPGPNGNQQTYLFCYASIVVHTQFWPGYPGQCFQCTELQQTGVTVLQSLVLPNGTYWAFTYDAANPADSTSVGYGEASKFGLPPAARSATNI